MSWLTWLDDKNNREKAAFLAAGVAALITAGWTVFTFAIKESRSDAKQSSSPPPVVKDTKSPSEPGPSGPKYLVCRSWTNHDCPGNADFISCDQMVPQWARQQCGGVYSEKTVRSISAAEAPMTLCGIHVAEITCLSSR